MSTAPPVIDRQKFRFQIVSTPTADTPGACGILHFDSKRYIFGRVGEGTQRALSEQALSVKKVASTFLTGETKWENHGGLLGLMLTHADVRVEAEDKESDATHLEIYGGPKLWHLLACARRFIFRTGCPTRIQECNPLAWTPDKAREYTDDLISVWSIPVQLSQHKSSSSQKDTVMIQQDQETRQKTVHDMFDSDWRHDKLVKSKFSAVSMPAMVWVRDPETKDLKSTYCSKLSDAPHIDHDQEVLVRTPWPAALLGDLPSAESLPRSVSMSYIVKAHAQRGRFDPRKAEAAGVPNGRLYGRLANGETITLPDETIVKPEDVVGPQLPPTGFAILDAANQEYFDALAIQLGKMSEDVLDNVDAFVWILGHGIADTPSFKAVLAKYAHVQHLVTAPELSPNHAVMKASAAVMTRLHRIRPSTFPYLVHDPPSGSPKELQRLSSDDTYRAVRGVGVEFSDNASVKVLDDQETLPPHVILRETRRKSWEHLLPTPSDSDESRKGEYDDVTVATLGTGSSVPSRYRNVSSNLVHVPSLGYVLLDAGENTLGQLKRLFQPEELDEVLSNLHMIWISHLHADHHLGTISVLQACQEARQRTKAQGKEIAPNLYVVSHEGMGLFLEDYAGVERYDHTFLSLYDGNFQKALGKSITLEETTLPFKALEACRVSHCHGSQAVAITFKNGFKIAYSGDCRPSKNFAAIGRGADILIHEATFDDGMEGDARAKKHSTSAEALGVASAMEAKNIILTHFSQRYQKLPTIKDASSITKTKFEDQTQNGEVEQGLENADALASIQRDRSKSRQPEMTPELATLAAIAKRMSVCVAFDLMRVNIPQIRTMYQYYPAIEKMFYNEQNKSDVLRATRRKEQDVTREERKAANKAKLAERASESKAAQQERLSRQASKRAKRQEKAKYNQMVAEIEKRSEGSISPRQNIATSQKRAKLAHIPDNANAVWGNHLVQHD